MTITAMTEAAAEAGIDSACRALHLPTVRAEAAPPGRHRGQGTPHAPRLPGRGAGRRGRPARRTPPGPAHRGGPLPRLKRLEDFDTAVAPAIAPATLAVLGRGAWIDAGEPVVLLGDSGTGKSHLLIALGMAACEAGRRVRYVTCASWVNELAEACDDRLLSKVVARYGRLDLLLVDELGYVSVDPKGWRRASWNPDAIALAASAPASSST